MLHGIHEADFTFGTKQAQTHHKAIAFPNKLKKEDRQTVSSKQKNLEKIINF